MNNSVGNNWQDIRNEQQAHGNNNPRQKRTKLHLNKNNKKQSSNKPRNFNNKPKQPPVLKGHDVYLERAKQSGETIGVLFIRELFLDLVVKDYDKYSIICYRKSATAEERDREMVVFKHAIQSISFYTDSTIVSDQE